MRVPTAQCEKNLCVVLAPMFCWFDVEESELSSVSRFLHIPAGVNMAVIPACSCRARDKGVALHTTWRDHRCPFFLSTIHVRGDGQTVQVNQLRNFGFVEYIYRAGLSLRKR